MMKIPLIFCLLLCLLSIAIGILFWFIAGPLLVKLIFSVLFIGTGISFGCIAITLLKEDY